MAHVSQESRHQIGLQQAAAVVTKVCPLSDFLDRLVGDNALPRYRSVRCPAIYGYAFATRCTITSISRIRENYMQTV